MMMSIQEAVDGGAGGGSTDASVATSVPAVSLEALNDGVKSFQSVTGVGGDTARYYVYMVLNAGAPADVAIQRYFDCDCAPAPDGWQCPPTRAAQTGNSVESI